MMRGRERKSERGREKMRENERGRERERDRVSEREATLISGIQQLTTRANGSTPAARVPRCT